MTHRVVGAGEGTNWFKQAIGLVVHNPIPLLVIALLFSLGATVLSLVPFLGSIAVALLAPVLAAGLMHAFREEHEGRGAQIEHLFRGFQEPGRLVPLVILGVPALLALLLIGIVIVAVLGSAMVQLMLGAGASSAGQLDFANVGVGLLVACGLGFFILLFALALVVFAIPRVMFDNVEPVAAMKESLAASLANFGALLVFGLMFIVSAIALVIVSLLVGWIPLLGPLVIFIAWLGFGIGYIAVSNGGIYLAWRALWPPAPASLPTATDPPAPPPA